jgi:hypothetical protein
MEPERDPMKKQAIQGETVSAPEPAKLAAHLSPEEVHTWQTILTAGAEAQRLIPGSVAVGGTAAALYAGHRISYDVDNLLLSLKDTFDAVLESLEQWAEWKTARTKRPVLILGEVQGIEIGFRQARRTQPIANVSMSTPQGTFVIPTLAEILVMKALLAYSRNVVRDYLDFAALTTGAAEAYVLEALSNLDRLYGHLQTSSVALEVAKSLSKPEPIDLQGLDLTRYRALAPEWQDWRRTEQLCQHYGILFGQRLVGE